MVWEDILIGFTVTGFVAVFVPASFWETVFLQGTGVDLPGWLITVENALVAPFVAGATFIGSMGNIPLATILNANGVFFAGIMAFIYSDLMVPPLVRVNAKDYGWRVARYVAGVMFVSIVTTALLLHFIFAQLGMIPESARKTAEIVQFKLDYSFWLNLLFAVVAGWMVFLHRRHVREMDSSGHDMGESGIGIKRIVVLSFAGVLPLGLAVFVVTRGNG